ncbi:uncharacterized protein LOC123317625 [Coccinella septempunctata]|uniref:uncharacterized protein LOC123317624 n=1 Tax=Coccinella septempunctata TaxID=41139 RepID=UPI001D066030|nr:uncharacterized protein LOC123317624 [Coccinella septempunctata]XP_044760165.1 uncharacterized protein LOC123317625 [Coccinella septempunctata]
MDENPDTDLTPGGLFEQIKEIYGNEVCFRCKSMINLNKKLASLKNRLIFLLRCRTLEVFPNHIINNIREINTLQLEEHPYAHLVDRCMRKFRKSILNIEIKISVWKKRAVIEKIKNINEQLKREKVCPKIIDTIENMSEKYFLNTFKKIKRANIKKFEKLVEDQTQPFKVTNADQRIKNYTDVSIPEEAKIVLGLGPKHGIVPQRLPRLELIKDIEDFAQTVTNNEEERNSIRNRCVGVINNFIRQKKPINDPLKKYYRTTSKFVRDHPNIIISNSDKGNTTVLMLREDYITEAEKMLNNESTYKKLKSDPTKKKKKHKIKLTIS